MNHTTHNHPYRLLMMLAALLALLIAACSGGQSSAAPVAQNDPQAETNSTTSNDTGNPAQAAAPTIQQSSSADQNSAAAQSITAEPALPLNDTGVQIVALVNGEAITLPEFERAFDRRRATADAGSYDTLATVELNLLIEQRLINQAAAAMNVTITDAEVDAEYQATRSQVTNDNEWRAWLAQNMFTEAEYRQSLHDALLTRRMIEAVTQVAGETVTEINARHILVETEAEADTVLQRLNAGEDFAVLAAELSRDVTSKNDGGSLEWFTVDDLLTPELFEYALTLQPGEIGGPVETMLGYHVIEVLEFGEREAIEVEQADIAAAQFAEWLRQQVAAAQIERYIEL